MFTPGKRVGDQILWCTKRVKTGSLSYRYFTSQLITGKWKLTVSAVSLEIFEFFRHMFIE